MYLYIFICFFYVFIFILSCNVERENMILNIRLISDSLAVGMVLLRADDFGLPQRRMRLFIIGINNKRAQNELISTPNEILTMAINVYLPVVKLKPPPVDACARAFDVWNTITIDYSIYSL